MNGAPSTSVSSLTADARLTPSLILLLASGAGLAAATIYYSQPALGVLGTDIHADVRIVGWIPTLSQLGYALGVLLLAPLGDRYDRRKIILTKAVALCMALLMVGAAPSIAGLLAASLVVGLAATLAQDIVPAAAVLAPSAHRGKVVGMVMTGLLLGILLSRVISGLVTERFGWRGMFTAAAVSIVLLTAALWRRLPRFVPTTTVSYGSLLASLAMLWRQHAKLRRAALAQGLLSIGFSAFWSTLAVMLHEAPFRLGAAGAGAFGLAGAAGALAAPLAGRIADLHGPERVTRLGAGIATASFGAMALLPYLPPPARLWLIAACAIGFDLGIQASLIAHQSIVYSIAPEARSRLNAMLMVGVFIGMATGGALGSQTLAAWGWTGVVFLASAASAAALFVRAYRVGTSPGVR